MGPDILLAVTGTLLAVSAIANAVQAYIWHDRSSAYKTLVDSCYDRERIVERDHAARVDGLLDRINTSPRIQVIPATGAVDNTEAHYIPDHPGGDDAWNDWVGAPSEDTE